MALVTLASVKGAPGVTTTALLVAALWPRPSLLAECDASGGDIAYRIPAPDGQPLDRETGLISLAAAARHDVDSHTVVRHVQRLVGGQDVLVGVGTSEQALPLSAQWPRLASVLGSLPGVDTIADLGRTYAGADQTAIVSASDALVLVVGTQPSEVAHLREALRVITPSGRRARPTPVHVVVVAPRRRTQVVREIEGELKRAEVSFTAVHHLAHDADGAAYFLGQIRGNPARTHLVRSAGPLVEALASTTVDSFVAAPGTVVDA